MSCEGLRPVAHKDARRRLAATYASRGDVRFPDLLRYLEYATVEPTGEDAFRLTLALRDLRMNAVQRRELLRDTQRALRLRSAGPDPKRQALEWLNEAERLADRPESRPSPPPAAAMEHEETEIAAARAAGEPFARSLRCEHQFQLRAVFAALAVAWLYMKPPRPNPELYMDEAVRDCFPW